MKKWIVLLSFSLMLLAACTGQDETQLAPVEDSGKKVPVGEGYYTEISVTELNSMPADKDFVLVNIHIPFEGDLPNTDRSIAYNVIDQHLDELPADKDSKIVLYCRSDRMSTIASETLVGLGYTNVWNVDGGMAAWEQAGYEIEGR